MDAQTLPDLKGRTLLQVIPELSAGGAERTTLEVAEAVIEAGGRAIVASLGGRLVPELEALGAELVELPLASKNPFTIRANAGRLAKLIRRENIEVIHARSRAPAWSALWAARRTGIHFVTTYHGAYSGTGTLKRLYNSVMARGDIVIANSGWTADHVRNTHRIAEARIFTIPRGVDLEAFTPEAVSSERLSAMRETFGMTGADPRLVLLLPGRLTSWKGQRVAVEALSRLTPDERARVHLVLAGDAQGRDAYVAELDAAIRTSGLSSAVTITGHVADMPAAYSLADIVLAPSTRPEAFGRVAAEASAMGKPVIVADHGGQRETVQDGETGLRVTPGSSEALAHALEQLLSLDASALSLMGKAGQALIMERFSKRGLQIATLGVYKTLLDQNKGH